MEVAESLNEEEEGQTQVPWFVNLHCLVRKSLVDLLVVRPGLQFNPAVCGLLVHQVVEERPEGSFAVNVIMANRHLGREKDWITLLLDNEKRLKGLLLGFRDLRRKV